MHKTWNAPKVNASKSRICWNMLQDSASSMSTLGNIFIRIKVLYNNDFYDSLFLKPWPLNCMADIVLLSM